MGFSAVKNVLSDAFNKNVSGPIRGKARETAVYGGISSLAVSAGGAAWGKTLVDTIILNNYFDALVFSTGTSSLTAGLYVAAIAVPKYRDYKGLKAAETPENEAGLGAPSLES
jgi:hypothetical protein